jgi:aldose 1-epimerase
MIFRIAVLSGNMRPAQQFCFTHKTGKDVYLFTLNNSKGTEVSITNYGAIITTFKIKKADGVVNDIVLGFNKVEDYLAEDYVNQYPWFGCAVGRYANRIKDGSFKIDGNEYQLTKNKDNDTLHGGAEGFDKKVWRLTGIGEKPFPFIELKYISPDGQEGFPGKLETTIRFELNEDNELSYEYNATCDKPTAVNLTHHEYFNLNNSKGSIHEQEVRIYASNILEQDKNLVATGKEISVEDTAFDVREFHQVGEGLKLVDEYDTSYVIDKKNTLLVAEARSLQSNIHLQVYSTEPVVHFYSGKWIPSIKGKNEEQYGSFSGFCLETHKHPNAVNIPHFPDTILMPGKTYYHKTTYKIIV